jgi:hypothetical protein
MPGMLFALLLFGLTPLVQVSQAVAQSASPADCGAPATIADAWDVATPGRLFIVPALDLVVLVHAGLYQSEIQGAVPLMVLNRYVLRAVSEN